MGTGVIVGRTPIVYFDLAPHSKKFNGLQWGHIENGRTNIPLSKISVKRGKKYLIFFTPYHPTIVKFYAPYNVGGMDQALRERGKGKFTPHGFRK